MCRGDPALRPLRSVSVIDSFYNVMDEQTSACLDRNNPLFHRSDLSNKTHPAQSGGLNSLTLHSHHQVVQ